MSLNPIFKWTGGKRREIKHFDKFFPSFIKNEKYTYVEPFVGGGAVYFHLNNRHINVINDFDKELINFYTIYSSSNELFISELHQISKITKHDQLEKIYYMLRDEDKNNGLINLSDIKRAIRFYVVNQLAFSGMRRFNSNGEFNVPFGHYKKLNINAINSAEHLKLLSKTKIFNDDFGNIMIEYDCKKTFMFLDPPYTRVFKKYSSNNIFDEKEHLRLAKIFANLKNAKCMLIIDKSEFTTKLYKDFIKEEYSLKYGVNIKNRFDTDAQHLIVCNY